ncbi:MAG: DEAD/DEAH box helicase [Rhodobacteraceae bacterium]|nr:DEAD/DEAH box helicase [Paracoccaceae bacterium]
MNRNPYVDLCVHLQALRRYAEEVISPLVPALGVAGSIYTHQVANVLRVLTDVRVRHLLADEVGLGKTVQALMILNTLRRQRRNLRALVVVPDTALMVQWRDELMTRAHTTPFETRTPGEGQYVRLAWEEQLRKKGADGEPMLVLADIDPERYQVLIVDELHRLSVGLQDRIVRTATEFEHILILTATPSFQRPKRHAELFALLEPERTARARWQVSQTSTAAEHGISDTDDLSSWPEWAAQEVVNMLLARDREAAEEARVEDFVATAMARCAYRRVIRTRRVDYSGVLPRRRHHPLVVEPLGAEADRQALMWRYVAHLDSLTTRFDPVLLAKRVILSPPSLEQRVDFFRRKGHEREGILERVKPLVHRSNGDSRADALVDLLATIWTRSPRERVLVAAQDNLTSDYLFELVQARLPEVGPLGARVPLIASRVRQGQDTDAADDLAAFGNETIDNLEDFQRGAAQVLFATERVQVGLNLQCARVLVLYSVPWRPEEVEQWIGRLDRIGNVAAFSEEGKAKTIDVYTIAQRGLVDEKVVTVLQRFHVFERSVNLDGAHLGEVAQLIENAALRPDVVNWRDLEDRSESMAAEDSVQELDSALRPHLPWNVEWATSQRARLSSMPPVGPVLCDLHEHAATGPKAWDRCVEPIFNLLAKAGDYHLRWKTEPETGSRFRTLWYRFGEREYGYRPVTAKVVFSFGEDPSHERSPRHAHAFITRRGDIGNPPRRYVVLTLDGEHFRRPLRFANFGNGLHDELIDNWAQPLSEPQVLEVMYFSDHALWRYVKPGWFLLRMTLLDPAAALVRGRVLKETIQEVAGGVTRSPAEQLPNLVAPFKSAATCAIEADMRWLRATLPAKAETTARMRTGQGWQAVSEDVVAALMNPSAHDREGLPHAFAATDSTAIADADRELEQLRLGEAVGQEIWSPSLPMFRAALSARARVVVEEARDATGLAGRELARAEAAVADAMERGNRAQITRAENLRDAAFDVARMTEVYWIKREAWLLSAEEALSIQRPRELLHAVIHARGLPT